MSVGGFKLSKFQWSGGRTDTEQERVSFVLKNVVQTILDSNSGWILDENYNETIDDFTSMKVLNDTGYNILLFLKNNNNARLALGYSTGLSYLRNEDCVIKYTVNLSDQRIAYGTMQGLYFSIIPSKNYSSDNWTIDSTYGVILPTHASRWTSFGYSYYSTNLRGGNDGSFVGANEVNKTYYYYILTKQNEDFIGFFAKESSWSSGLLKGFLIGSLIKSVAHESDQSITMILPLWTPSGKYDEYTVSSKEGNAREKSIPSSLTQNSNSTSDSYNYEDHGFINQETNYWSNVYFKNNLIQFQNANDEFYYSFESNSDGNVQCSIECSNVSQLSVGCVSDPNFSSGGRWCPLYTYLYSTDPSTLGVVEFDGFKGYLDTDIIRCVTIGRYTKGSTFGSGSEFIYIGGGIIIGWDSSNTETFF